MKDRIEQINRRIEPFYISEPYRNGEYGLVLPFTFLDGEYENYGQDAFNRYAELNGEPVQNRGFFTHGNGYEWEEVFKTAFEERDGFDTIDFDCEAGGFYAYCTDLDLLENLAVEFKALCENKERFQELVCHSLGLRDMEMDEDEMER